MIPAQAPACSGRCIRLCKGMGEFCPAATPERPRCLGFPEQNAHPGDPGHCSASALPPEPWLAAGQGCLKHCGWDFQRGEGLKNYAEPTNPIFNLLGNGAEGAREAQSNTNIFISSRLPFNTIPNPHVPVGWLQRVNLNFPAEPHVPQRNQSQEHLPQGLSGTSTGS